ncbi:hypothetical protein CKO31_17775 [Thiohalocapsa halophila]|uniref:Mur ligase N-terminal catalytic domain-containing protein n=1 Tax=Thiohalocapsa halophila TaxID=69359 RepID=A0ABS1CL41_9GAMM|nr:hypothetical protein [Thiohalocapsa halophila]
MAGVQRAPSAASWPLAELLGGFAVLPFESGPRVSDLTLHSAQARPGCLFLACAGRRTHGLVHAAEPDADWGETELARLAGDLSLPVIPVPSLAKRAADRRGDSRGRWLAALRGERCDGRDAVAREGSRSEGRGARSEERLAPGAKHRSASAIRRTRRPEAARAETTLSPQPSALPRWSAC